MRAPASLTLVAKLLSIREIKVEMGLSELNVEGRALLFTDRVKNKVYERLGRKSRDRAAV